jgi:hypothetical protein
MGSISKVVTPASTAFNPLSIAWDYAYWAEDPAWTPPADGGALITWRNAANPTFPLTPSGTPPTFQASDPHLGGKPSLKVGYGAAPLYTSGAPTIVQPGTVVVVFYYDATGATIRSLFDGSVQRWFWRMNDGGAAQGIYAGTVVDYGAPVPAGSYFACITFNGAASSAFVNGNAPTTAPSSPGAGSFQDIYLNTNGSTNQTAYGMNGSIAFFGVKGNMAPTDITHMQTWAKNHYGLPY